MGWKRSVRRAVNAVLERFGFDIVERRYLYEWQIYPDVVPRHNSSGLPQEAAEYLHPNHPRLQALQARYAVCDPRLIVSSFWAQVHLGKEEMRYFRGDNAFVWQLRGRNMSIMAYTLTAFYLKSIDRLGLLDTLKEDDLFGNFTFFIDGKIVSRDLLDSIAEIYFLDRHLRLSSAQEMTVLDIGAGYGRLAHRMTCGLTNIQHYLCTDAVAVSSFIAEYYLRFRGVEGRASVLPLDEVENTLQKGAVRLAVNIHSFSECTLPAIDWWVSLLAKYGVRYFMVVPNADDHGGECLRTIDGQDFGAVIERHGYRLVAKDPKYLDPVVQKYAINPTYHYLFELS